MKTLLRLLVFVFIIVSRLNAETWVNVLSGTMAGNGGAMTVLVQIDADYSNPASHRFKATMNLTQMSAPPLPNPGHAVHGYVRTGPASGSWDTQLMHGECAAFGFGDQNLGPLIFYVPKDGSRQIFIARYWGPAGGDQTMGAYNPGSGVPAPDKQMHLTIPGNSTPYTLTWQVVNKTSGAIVGGPWVQGPGSMVANVTVTGLPPGASSSDYELVYKIDGYALDEGNAWKVVSGGAETYFTVTPGPAAGHVTTAGTSPTVGNTMAPTPPTTLPSAPAPAPGTGGTVWTAPTGGGATTGLTNAVFREGVDKITTRQDKQQKSLDKITEVTDMVKAAKDANPSDSSVASQRTSAVDTAKTAYSLGGAPKSIGSATAPGMGSSSPFSFSVMGRTIDMNPDNSPRAVQVMAWIKATLAWLLTAGWSYWLYTHFRELTSVNATPQLRGHDAAMGTGAQATALGNAVVWTVVILALPVAFTAMLTSAGLSMPAAGSLIDSPIDLVSGMGAAGEVALHLVSRMIPWSTLILCLIGPVLVSAFSIPIYIGVQVAIRWLIA